MVTEGKVANIKVGKRLNFAPGTIIVDNGGYTDYTLWGRWCYQAVYFVIRTKDPDLYEAIEKCPYSLWRIEVEDSEPGRLLILITNHNTLGASMIAAIYKDRIRIAGRLSCSLRHLSRTSRSRPLWEPVQMPSRFRFKTQIQDRLSYGLFFF